MEIKANKLKLKLSLAITIKDIFSLFFILKHNGQAQVSRLILGQPVAEKEEVCGRKFYG